MQIHQLKIKKSKSRKRIGRGGKKGTYSGRGMKGQKSRSGAKINPIFEGGRSTLIEHLPKKRGFTSIFPKNQIVGLSTLEKIFNAGDTVTPAVLLQKGLIGNKKAKVKILNNGEITKAVNVKNCLISKAAKEKIEKAGGKIVNDQ
ncbi:MAG: 50S ribosomal protein L15 [Candidatus Moranbacteria bacterium]|nr:50S ribosomal protein L15 [Candidatus Moranbacteria bacterium]